jgi:general secretion pathway protein K
MRQLRPATRQSGAPRAKKRHGESGVALLSALLSVALLTMIVVEMTESTFVHSHLTRNAGNAMAARLLARSGQLGASEALRAASEGDAALQAFVDAIVEGPPISLPTAQGHVLQIGVRDESARLNINEASRQAEAFERLFAELGLDPRLLDAVRTRIDPDGEGRLGDPRSDCTLPLPCDPPGGELRSMEDLRTIRGFDEPTLARLAPFVTAHRSRRHRGEINLRTARLEVLRAVGCEETESLGPPPRSAEDISAWLENGPCSGASPSPRDLKSRVYRVSTLASVGDATQGVDSILEVGRGPITWQQQSVWGAGPGGVP